MAFDRFEDFKHLDTYQELEFGREEELDLAINHAIKSGKEKKIHGIQEYHCMNPAEKHKYFRKMSKEYQHQLKKAKEQKEKIKEPQKTKKKNQPRVSFSGSIYYKTFNANAKPTDVSIADEKK